MFETIVVPLDGSDLAESALSAAQELARALKSKLLLVQAIESLPQRMTQPASLLESPAIGAVSVDVLQQAVDAEKVAADQYLGAKREALKAAGIEAEAYVGEGSASEVIIKLASDTKAGMIVMSTHGRGGLGRLLFGSVADAILKNSAVPVLLIRVQDADRS